MSGVGRHRLQDILHLFGDVDVALLADLLHDEAHREERRQVGRAHGLQRDRVQHGRQRLGRSAWMLYHRLGISFCESR